MDRRQFLAGTAAFASSAVASPAIAQGATEVSFFYPIAVGGPITKIIDGYAADFEKANPSVKVIILTMHLEKHFVTEAFRAGVSGYVLKQSVTDELLFAIKEVLKGRTYVSPLVTQSLVEQALQPSPSPAAVEPAVPAGNLSLRQREVLQLVAEGKSTKEIASTLNVSIKTVEFHKTRIMKELKLHSTAELTKHAIAIGLVSVNEAVTSNAPR